MKKYLICNYGCDDENEFEMELTEEQAKFLIKVFEENNKIADYQCKPSLYICSNYTKENDEYDGYAWYRDKSYMNKSYEELKGEQYMNYKLKDDVDFNVVNKKSKMKFDFDLSDYYSKETRMFEFPKGYVAWHLMAEVFKEFLIPLDLVENRGE